MHVWDGINNVINIDTVVINGSCWLTVCWSVRIQGAQKFEMKRVTLERVRQKEAQAIKSRITSNHKPSNETS